MTRYQIHEDPNAVSIKVTAAEGQQDQLLHRFAECQAGPCACPTDEYWKLQSMDVQRITLPG